MTKPDPVAAAERKRARGDISRQRLSQVRKRHGAPPARMGAPPLPVSKLRRNGRGNVEVSVLLPPATLAAVDVLVKGPPPLRGRKAVLSHALPLGFAEMRERPPEIHEAPAGERTARGERGHVIEVAPRLLTEIDAYAREHETARSVVVAMAAVVGVEAMRAEKGTGA